MKVVVTGDGFIGANLCRALSARHRVDEVVALDDLSSGFAANPRRRRRVLVEGDFGAPRSSTTCSEAPPPSSTSGARRRCHARSMTRWLRTR